MKNSIIPVLAFSVLLVAACTEKEDSPTPQSNAEMNIPQITDDWQIVAHTQQLADIGNEENNEEIDLYSNYDLCETDDVLRINTNGTYTIEPGEFTCVPAESPLEVSAWRFNAERTAIVLNEGNNGKLHFIEQLDESILCLRTSVQINGLTYYERKTFVRA